MTGVNLNDLCDHDGFLVRREDWSEEVAKLLAKAEGIALCRSHWEIIALLQTFHNRYGDSPANRALASFAKEQLGPEKGSSLYLMKLFPGSPARVGSRIAGLPKPKNCL